MWGCLDSNQARLANLPVTWYTSVGNRSHNGVNHSLLVCRLRCFPCASATPPGASRSQNFRSTTLHGRNASIDRGACGHRLAGP